VPDEDNLVERALTAAREVLAGHHRKSTAARHNVSQGSLDRARRVLSLGIPEVVIAVENREASLNWGSRVANFPPERQAELVQLLRPGYRRKTMMDPRLLSDSHNSRPVTHVSSLTLPDNLRADVVLRAIGNLEALEMRLHNSVLDPGMTPDEAKQLLAQLSKHGGAYRLLRRMLTTRKEGKDLA
jgi:hypothetical protein